MPTLTINGKEITVPSGTTVIQAAEKLGFSVPFYCYHPGLSIAGNCRMCLVEIEKMPRLQIACHLQCADGMVVHTETERVKQTRKHVLEFLLVNHPLDCPVCDQAGECWLQDYYMEHGLYESRLDEPKVKKKKAVPIGPHVMLDSERCILCSRCVRFCDEITKTGEFGIFNRGDRAEIGLYPGKELTNPYSGNVVDICPVGALTDRDFRFKCRVWYLKKVNSICAGCARGCNITVEINPARPQHGRGDRVMRLKPRCQPAINQWWMCDEGRYGYQWMDRGRLTEPALRRDRKQEPASWQEAMDEAAARLGSLIEQDPDSVLILLSPDLSNEALFLAKKLFVKELGLRKVLLVSSRKEGCQDDFLIRADKHPNRKGAEFLGFSEKAGEAMRLIRQAEEGKLKALYLFGQDLITLFPDDKVEEAIKNLELVIFQGTNRHLSSEAAGIVLPAAAYLETEGTLTNFEGKVQRFSRALSPLGDSKPDAEILIVLAEAMGFKFGSTHPEAVGEEMRSQVKAFRDILENNTRYEEKASP